MSSVHSAGITLPSAPQGEKKNYFPHINPMMYHNSREFFFISVSHGFVFRFPDTRILISKPVKNSLESNIGSLQQAYTY